MLRRNRDIEFGGIYAKCIHCDTLGSIAKNSGYVGFERF
jgi:hypothetical protein